MTSFRTLSADASALSSLTLVAIRCWRIARDARQPAQPALFAMLAEHRCGILAPSFDGLLRVYEACTGRAIHARTPDAPSLSADEYRLIGLIERPEQDLSLPEIEANSGLIPAMRIALQSTRLMLRQALAAIDPPRLLLRPPL